jgi:DNA repair exonuclease SbcCD ATPase subunit
MMQDTIAKIENRLQQSVSLPEQTRAELLSLLAQLKVEVARLSQTHKQHAENIASCTDASTFEATRSDKNTQSLQQSINGLEASVNELEASHPQLAGVVSRLANMLSNMGI